MVPANGTGTARFVVRVPHDFWWPVSRVAIAADLTVDGRRFGEIAEAVVDLEPRHHPHVEGATAPQAHEPPAHRHGDEPEHRPHTHHSTGMHGANI
jgi:hypothetical protein